MVWFSSPSPLGESLPHLGGGFRVRRIDKENRFFTAELETGGEFMKL
jgi:hypothetical protein